MRYPRNKKDRVKIAKSCGPRQARVLAEIESMARINGEEFSNVQAWRVYCIFQSPALLAGDWPVEDSQIHGGERKYPWRRRKTYRWVRGACLCGCGASCRGGFVKTRTFEHERMLRRRVCRLILRYTEPNDLDPRQISLAIKHCPGILSDEERKLFREVQKIHK